MAPVEISAFADKQLKLLSDELKAETEETSILTSTHAPTTLARAGLAVLNLAVGAQRTGLGGKTVIDLSLDNAVAGDNKELPEHGLRVGDIVGLSEQPKGAERKKAREDMEKKMAQGVVVKVQKEALVVALDKDDVDIPAAKLWMCVDPRLQRVRATRREWLMKVLYIASNLQMMLPTRGISSCHVMYKIPG